MEYKSIMQKNSLESIAIILKRFQVHKHYLFHNPYIYFKRLKENTLIYYSN